MEVVFEIIFWIGTEIFLGIGSFFSENIKKIVSREKRFERKNSKINYQNDLLKESEDFLEK